MKDKPEKSTIFLSTELIFPDEPISPVMGHPLLIQYSGNSLGKRFVLLHEKHIIGRNPTGTDIWLNDPSISRFHCRIDLREGVAWATDLGSLNQTFVNQTAVSIEHEIRHGDLLKVGNILLRYYAPGTADQLLMDSLYQMAVQDRQLGVFRKEYLLDRLEEEFTLARARTNPLSLAFFDIDEFKPINDVYGHHVGDTVLQKVCQLLQTVIRPQDTLGRFGGDEFCLIFPETPLPEAVRLCEGIRKEVNRATLQCDGMQLTVTMSIGVTTLNDQMADIQALIRAADALVYQAKQQGRNCVAYGHSRLQPPDTSPH